MSGTENQDVALAEANALGLFTLLQFRGTDSFPGFQPLDPAQPRDVEQNSAADDSVCIGSDVLELRAAGGDLCGRLAVIQASLVRDMAKGVDVGVTVTMDLAGKIVQCEAGLPKNGGAIERHRHVMCNRVRIVRTGDLVESDGHGNRSPRSHQRRGVSHAFGSNVIQRTTFILGAPGSPVTNLLK